MNSNEIGLTLVFVFQNPDFLPLNPIVLIDKGVFTKDEVKNGPMDFGPGYVLRSNKGYTLVREVQRALVMFDAEKINDIPFVTRVVNVIIECLKIKATALGVNFSTIVNGPLSKRFQEVEARMSDSYFGGAKYVPGYSFEIAEKDYRSKLSIVAMPDAVKNGGFKMSVNNHFDLKDQMGVVNALDRILRLKAVFAALRKEFFA